MTAAYATTARPANAAIAWATKDALFVEIPSKVGPPFIVRYRKTVEGLSEALNILIEHQESTHRHIPTDHPAIKRPPPPTKVAWATDAEREKARAILKRLKII